MVAGKGQVALADSLLHRPLIFQGVVFDRFLRKRRFPILHNYERRAFLGGHSRDEESLSVGRYIETRDRMDRSSSFGGNGEKRSRRTEFRFRRKLRGNGIYAPVEREIEQLLTVASPAQGLGAGAGYEMPLS